MYNSQPMIGLIPCLGDAVDRSTVPFITPWSVSASAGWSNDAALAASASILQAPSSSEYSEWTWRWTQEELMNRSFRGSGPGRKPWTSRGARATVSAALCAFEPASQQAERALVAVDLQPWRCAARQHRQQQLRGTGDRRVGGIRRPRLGDRRGPSVAHVQLRAEPAVLLMRDREALAGGPLRSDHQGGDLKRQGGLHAHALRVQVAERQRRLHQRSQGRHRIAPAPYAGNPDAEAGSDPAGRQQARKPRLVSDGLEIGHAGRPRGVREPDLRWAAEDGHLHAATLAEGQVIGNGPGIGSELGRQPVQQQT